MGDPKKQRKKYTTPFHPWQGERIEEEKELLKTFGLKNKREIWKIKSTLKKFAQQAKKLVASEPKSEIEKNQLMTKLTSLGLIGENTQLEGILTLTPKDIAERRLQTMVYKKNLSKSLKQARQFITHRHISVDGNLITSPSYLVTKDKEDKIIFVPSSSLSNPEHVERAQTKEKKKPGKVIRPQKKKAG